MSEAFKAVWITEGADTNIHGSRTLEKIADEKHFKRVLEDDPPVLSLVRASFDDLYLFLPHRHLQFVDSAFVSLPSSQFSEEERFQSHVQTCSH
ncbi:Zinc-metallopeptidase, peroxisomal [Senna tora]|uniref:Zinc-metallopeptidase, peroxisomal n=1 Tax=Senna tora TaxID=362788 RepID=A0A834TBM9_9FABA|nr:Zinc-metallopeptidase, peroxisomal [Senna tora]